MTPSAETAYPYLVVTAAPPPDTVRTIDLKVSCPGGTQTIPVHTAAHATAPVVLVVPALGVRSTYYTKFATRLAALGVHAAPMDVPGHGAHPTRAARGQDWGYDEVVDHLTAVRKEAQAAFPQSPIFWVGHSIGGQVALMEAGRHHGVAGVAIVASGSPYWKSWPGFGGPRVRASTLLCNLIARTLGYFPGHKLGFGGREPRTLIVQWAQLSGHGRYQFDNFDGDALLNACTCPVLSIGISDDTLAPAPAIEHTLQKLGTDRLERLVWNRSPDPNAHNRWPSTPDYPAERIVRFLEDLGPLGPQAQ